MSMNRMDMHPLGPLILAAMPDHKERNVGDIAATLGMKVPDVRNGIDWLFANGYVSKRKDAGINLNMYSNKEHKSECEKALRRLWV